MGISIDSIKNLNDSKETWRLAIRVLDVWSVVNTKGNEHLEMVVMDSKGDKIQVLISADNTPKWKGTIKENMTCIITNGAVYDNDFQWKLCDHSKKFVFLGGTYVRVKDIHDIPPKQYNFIDFAEILKGNCKLDRLQDIIGYVHEIVNRSISGGKKVVVDVNLKDLKGNVITCSLWESYGTKFLNYYNQNKNSGAIVIILTHAMIKDTQVSNGWSGSKLMINDDIQEIQEFKAKLPMSDQNERPTQSTQSRSQWSGGSQYTPEQKFVFNATSMTLKDICSLKVETTCITVATTDKFSVSKFGWFYLGCTGCTKKAVDPKNPYKCSCGAKVKEAIPRYKIEIWVKNDGAKYRFVFWDIECEEIIGKSAATVYQSMVEAGEDDPMVYPDELNDLLHKKMVFRVKVQPGFGCASVYKYSTQEQFINKIESELNIDENQSQIKASKADASDGATDIPTQSLSACGENDLDTMSSITPAKRGPCEEKVEDMECSVLGSTQLSGTKPLKQVKIEPNN